MSSDMPHPLPFVNLDAKWLSELAEHLETPDVEHEVDTKRLRKVAEHLERLDAKVRHLPQKSED